MAKKAEWAPKMLEVSLMTSSNGVPSRKGCVVNGQINDWGKQKKSTPPTPSPYRSVEAWLSNFYPVGLTLLRPSMLLSIIVAVPSFSFPTVSVLSKSRMLEANPAHPVASNILACRKINSEWTKERKNEKRTNERKKLNNNERMNERNEEWRENERNEEWRKNEWMKEIMKEWMKERMKEWIKRKQ